jgi:diphthine-ammonia ligase
MTVSNAQIPPYTFISGQIGLIPSSLTLPSPSPSSPSPQSSTTTTSSTLPLETALVLQHTARIIRAAPNSRLGDGSEGGFGRGDSGSEPGIDDVSGDESGEGGWIQLAIYYLVHIADVDHVRKNVELVDGVRTVRPSSLDHANPVTIKEADTDALCSRVIPSTRCSR